MNTALICILASQVAMLYILYRQFNDINAARNQLIDLKDEMSSRDFDVIECINHVVEYLNKIDCNLNVIKNSIDYPSERLVKRPRTYVRKESLPHDPSLPKRSVGRPRKSPQTTQESSSPTE